MEETTMEICMTEIIKPGGSSLPTGGRGYDTSMCDRLGISEIMRRDMALEHMKHIPTFNELPTPSKLKLSDIPLSCWFFTDDVSRAEAARDGRKLAAERFTSQYVYGISIDGCNDTMEQRTCIWSEDTCLWLEKSSGITWVGVHGADSVCVVTRSGDLDKERLLGNLKISTVQNVLAIFRKSVICEFEDLADPSSDLRQRFRQSIKKPFGVVSANPGTNDIHKRSGHEASGAGYDEKRAIEFLRENMKSGTDFTVSETTKTAICAFQRMFRKKLKATDIAVSVLDPEYFVDASDKYKDPTVKELEICEIDEYLAILDEHPVVIDDLCNPLKKQRMISV